MPELKGEAKVVYVFPGQGSQWAGMGSDLYRSSSSAREVFEETDEALSFPLSRLCFEGPEEELRQTINAQPAILMVSLACLKAALDMGRLNGMTPPAFVAGHSLGEYTALVAADVLNLSEAVRLVRERGRLMQEAGAARPGGMVAIIGMNQASLEEICRETGVQIANINCPEQLVISGPKESLTPAIEMAKERGARRTIPLPVNGSFHSSSMAPTVDGMAEAISTLHFNNPSIPVVANSTALPLTTAEGVKAELLEQLCHCVQWQRSIEHMVEAGGSAFIEIGPGQVLTGLIKRINKNVQTLNIGDTLLAGP
ncbi:ACP S-malonyltransferase [Chloroflexota bacterium]